MAYSNGIYSYTRSKSENHIKENINIFDFKLTNEEMTEISKLNKNEPFYVRTDEALKRLQAGFQM